MGENLHHAIINSQKRSQLARRSRSQSFSLCLGWRPKRESFSFPTGLRIPFWVSRIPGGGGPPFGFNDDEFRTPLVQVDPRLIVYLPNDHGRKTEVFPVVRHSNDRQKRTTLWVKAGIGAVQQEDAAAVEKLLKAALSEVQREKDAPSQAENDQREIKPSSNTGAFVSLVSRL